MNTSDQTVIPVLLGGDLNCYNIARAFHERYGVPSYAFGNYPIGAVMNSKIITFTAVKGLDQGDTIIGVLSDFAAKVSAKPILFGCTDRYAELIAQYKDELSPMYHIPYIDYDLMSRLTDKAEFYSLCERHGIPYPKTVVLHPGDSPEGLPFEMPVIIKPAKSSLYWRYPFEGMKKVYRAATADEAGKIVADIRASGYPGDIIVQDTIPGDDYRMYVLTAYCDRSSECRMLCLGHVLLEEHTPKGLGNHAAIVTEYNRELMERFAALLHDIGYVGYANFDIKFDSRDGSLRAFEINTRLGRSNYYVTAAGNNVAEYPVSEYIFGDVTQGCVYSDRQIYWRYIPDITVMRRIPRELAERVRRLKRERAAFSSMRYPWDLKLNPKRRFYVAAHELRQMKKFAKYYNPEIG